MSRTRHRHRTSQKTAEWWYDNKLYYTINSDMVSEEIGDNKNSRPWPKHWSEVFHVKSTKPLEAYSYPYYGYEIKVRNDAGNLGWAGTFIDRCVQENAYAPLDFQENNSFELIPAIFDLDGTIAMFARKFWRQISYGAINWGLLPFISDIRSLINSVRDITENRIADQLSKSQEKEMSRPWRYELSTISGPARFNGRFHFAGTIEYRVPDLSSSHLALYLILDELGVHPDLKTVWDVIPLSFVADYFLPVGDYLEAVHPRGWFRPTVNFTGGFSVKGTMKCPPSEGPFQGKLAEAELYYRQSGSFVGSSRPPVRPQWSAPNARQLFNTAYLARARMKH